MLFQIYSKVAREMTFKQVKLASYSDLETYLRGEIFTYDNIKYKLKIS